MRRWWLLAMVGWAGLGGAWGDISIRPYGSVEAGFESNVFQSPDNLPAVSDPVKEDVFFRSLVGSDLEWDLGTSQKIALFVDHEEVRYASHTAVNRYGTTAALDYLNKGAVWDKGVELVWETQQERGVDVDGLPLGQTYAYQSLGLFPRWVWYGALFSEAGETEWSFSLGGQRNDFEAPPSPNMSQDNTEISGRSRFRQELSPERALVAQYEVVFRKYDDYLARLSGPANAVGVADPNGERRRHLDHRLGLSHQWRPGKGDRYEVGVKIRRLDDGFQDYYSYNNFGVFAKGKHRFSTKTELSGKAAYSLRSYDVQTLSTTDPTKRGTRDLDGELKALHPLGEHWNLLFSYVLESQTSNVKTPGSPLQGYTNHILTAGLSAAW